MKSPPRRWSAARTRRLLWLLILAAVAIVGIRWWQRPPRVQVVLPARRDVVTSVVTTGTVETVTIAPGTEMGGRIDKLLARQGQPVAANELLATLDTRELEARLREAETALEAARLKQTAAASSSQPQTELAKTGLAQARVRVSQAERDWRDLQTLADRGAVPRVEAENARMGLRTARLQEQEAATRLRQLGMQARQELRQAEVGVAAARAALDTLRAQQARTRITAPVEGVVTEILAHAGETLAPGAPLLKIARLDSMRVSVQLDEQHLGQVRVGQRVRMATDAFPDRPFTGEVEKISPAVDPEQGTIQVHIRPATVPGYLRPEMTIDVNIVTGRFPHALTLPRHALDGPAGARKVWVVTDEERAEPRPVEVVQGEGGEVAVVQGLGPRERVIVNPPRLRKGQRVDVISS